ncbi:hypothetical protein FXO37_11545 [Capsicum annuum]|nr:hypothetical protein FXO37_11545 [Capsicum annuum]
MLCLEFIEWHPADRVMRQFELPQHISEAPLWKANHAKHDDRSSVDQLFIAEHNQAVNMLIHWQPIVLEAHHDADLDAYMGWYIPIAPSHEVMRRGLKKLYDKVLAWTLSPDLVTREYGAEIANVIRRTFEQGVGDVPLLPAPEPKPEASTNDDQLTS